MNTKYTVREDRTFANYRAKAVVLLNSYKKYEKEYCGSLLDEVTALLKAKALDVYREKSRDLTEADIMTPEFLDLLTKQNELAETIKEAKEMFLIENDYANAKKLCEIYYTDCVFNSDEFDDYFAVYEFLMETIDGFFLKHRNILNSVNSGKSPLTTK